MEAQLSFTQVRTPWTWMFHLLAGETAKKMVADIQAAGGIITLEDLANYRVQWEEPTTHKLKNLGYTLISSPPPGSGAILSSILGVRPVIH